MALVKAPGTQFSIGLGGLGTNTYVLGDGSDGVVSTFAVQIHESTNGTCSFTVQGRSRVVPTGQTAPPFEPIPYLPLHLNGAVGTYGTGSSVALTTDSVILIPATGLEIALDVTYTDGQFDVYVTPMVGAAA